MRDIFRSIPRRFIFMLWILWSVLRETSVDASLFNFSSIPPAKNVNESQTTFDDRRDLVLQWFSSLALRPCNDEDNDEETNCRLDSRNDVRHLCDWTIAKIILEESVQDAEDIILDASSLPFAVSGTSMNKDDPDAICHRKGDYDFALINWLHLIYVSRDHPGILSAEAYTKIVTEFLTLYGNDHDASYGLSCGLTFQSTTVRIEETENHDLMEEVSQYLTNQLLAELAENEGNTKFDNDLNGNNDFMMEYLAHFFEEGFYEYNSRPYQGFTVLPLSLLSDYAQSPGVALAAEMLLDVISGWTAVQTNNLRRFMPFRRQRDYIAPPGVEERQGWFSWSGDGGQ